MVRWQSVLQIQFALPEWLKKVMGRSSFAAPEFLQSCKCNFLRLAAQVFLKEGNVFKIGFRVISRPE